MMKTLELFEWERGTKTSPFSESELRILKKFNDTIQRKEKADAITVIYDKIYTYSFVGIIQIGKKRVEILPKLYNPNVNIAINSLDVPEQEILKRSARKNLFHLLSVTGLIPYYKSEISRYGKDQDFFEFLITLFLNDLENVMGSHFHHEYISQSEDLMTIKGKLNFQNQAVKLPTQLHTFSCNYDEFSIDNPLNRIIKATLKKIQELCRNEDNKKRSFNFYSLMHEIQEERITPSYVSHIHFSRLNENYENIIEFCSMILFGSTYSADEGDHHYYALIFDMNLVFEKYVAQLLRNSLPKYTFDCQADLYLVSEHEPAFNYTRTKKRMIPDIIVRENGKPVAILDTKYKPDLVRGYMSNADTYQMLAYSVANDSDRAVLLYPKLPNQERLNERDQCVVLDKMRKEKKVDRAVIISGREIHLFDPNGKILMTLTAEDAQMMRELLTSKLVLAKENNATSVK